MTRRGIPSSWSAGPFSARSPCGYRAEPISDDAPTPGQPTSAETYLPSRIRLKVVGVFPDGTTKFYDLTDLVFPGAGLSGGPGSTIWYGGQRFRPPSFRTSTFGYFLTKNIAFETLCCVPRHFVMGSDSFAGSNIGAHGFSCVWVKDNGGMGGLYRSRHEFVGVFRVPGARHRNNIELGKHGRNRTNVWEYPGAATFSKASEEGRLIELHPTVKPVALIADALLDCSIRGDVVLDPFLRSGSTLTAAERTSRICRGIEIDPIYVDVAIRRWRRMTGDAAIHVETGAEFSELETRDRGDANVG
jgi:hypothetical protein